MGVMSDQSDFEFASQLIASNESDKAGQDIIKLLEKVAADRRHALETAQRLSHELQNAENRIAQLEAEVQLYKAKMERAKQWLHNIFSAIEERLLG
jgi:predicted  nucleic acid-binding Zn-ribbon protein